MSKIRPAVITGISSAALGRVGLWLVGEALSAAVNHGVGSPPADRPRLGVGAERLRPVERVAGMPGPKLFIDGAEDRHTSLAESRRLYEAAGGPKELWVVEGAAHTGLHAAAGLEYERRVLDFFADKLRP